LKIHKSENPDDKTLSISVRNGRDGFHLNDRLPDGPVGAVRDHDFQTREVFQ